MCYSGTLLLKIVTSKGQVALEDKTVYLCQKYVITMKPSATGLFTKGQNLVADGQTSKDAVNFLWSRPNWNKSKKKTARDFFIWKWFDRLCVTVSMRLKLRNMNMNPGDQYFLIEMQQFPQFPPQWIYPGLPSLYKWLIASFVLVNSG